MLPHLTYLVQPIHYVLQADDFANTDDMQGCSPSLFSIMSSLRVGFGIFVVKTVAGFGRGFGHERCRAG